MKLYVTMVDTSPFQAGAGPIRRMVEVELSPEQSEQLTRKHTGGYSTKAGYINTFEEYEMCVLSEGREGCVFR